MIAAAFALLLSLQDIDREIEARAEGPLAPRSSDAEFLRRITLDLAGTLPGAEQVRAFLAKPDRAALIDRLLAAPDYARRMEQAVTVMFLERRSGGKIADALWVEHLRKSFATNVPWDQVVRGLLLADGVQEDSRPAMKLFADGAGGDPNRMTQDVSRLFLGRNLLCAQCHDHPSVKDYKQVEYMGLFAYLNASKLQDDPKTKKPILVEGLVTSKVEFASVFSPAKKGRTGPRLQGGAEHEIPAFEKGKEYERPPSKDVPGIPKFRPREMLADELVRHPRFARTSVNRFWFLFMGRGLIHPLDLDHSANPPSHPELLDALAADFASTGYDVRRLVKRIVSSEAYQRSGRLNAPPDRYRAALPKPLSAEQMAWATMTATGALERVQKAPDAGPTSKKFSSKDYLTGKITEPPAALPDVLRLFVDVFGNGPGEPETSFQPSMSQALFLMNDRLILDWLKPRDGNLIARLAAKSGDALAEELYLAILSRPPSAEEKSRTSSYLERNGSRRDAALGELAWALLASAEFRLNP